MKKHLLTRQLISTRMFPIGTAVTNSRWLAGLVAGSSLMGSLPAIAADWDGSASQDWNTPANWSGDAVPAGQNVFINDVSVNIPKISANIAATPVDILIGNGAGTVGRLDHTAGQASTGGGNWMLVGRQNGGDGTYNLADTSAAGGTLTGFGKGSGSMAVSGRLYVGGANYGGSIGTGKVNVNTSGTLAIGNDLAVGSAGGTGVMNVDAGTITTGGWNFIGKNESTTGIDGLLEQANEWNVSIFPNPASGTQSLKMNLPKASSFTMNLVDATGRCVKEQNLGMLEKGEQLIPLDLSAYPAGLFTLLLRSNHFSITKKLVKN